MSFEAVVEEVRGRVVPDDDERAALESVVEELSARAEAAVAELPVEADVRLVGSTARGTWLAGDRDVDLFVRFPTAVSREALERHGLAVGTAVIPDGHEEYAEHPYVTGEVDGVDVDCVPCYAVESATAIRSAVDRTPFHTDYLEGRIDPLADDVRLAKAFLTGVGVYGSDLRTRGFSGFLTELLVLEYGGFRPLVEAAADWQPPVRIDPDAGGDGAEADAAGFDDPLVVVDPTDPNRNVAAVCSARNVARLTHAARELLADPRPDQFEVDRPDSLSVAEARDAFADRETTPVAVRFTAPDVVDDQLYPQLDKSLAGVEGALERAGFQPLRTARFADETAVLLVECGVDRLPAVSRHRGPPVGVREHAEDFFETYAEDPDVTGPFVDEAGHYVVERPREARTPAALIEARLFDVSLGPHVETALSDGHEVLVGADVAALAEAFGVELAAYVSPEP
ncbi:CCA tRNA nucleotidyltransferase [Halobacteriales archaeon QH_7_69_31]|nr:MAG: CCA tRNA nucleotidyltransferase [Halobacteriales archaeon QH_7_69_31]